MLENIKKISIQTLVLIVNIALVISGVSYFKNQQEKKDLANNTLATGEATPVATVDSIAEKAAQLQQIIEKNSAQKAASASKNTGQVTVQQPKTVTQVIPGGTKTVTTTAPSSSSTSTPAPAKTTKKS